jgi:hypothetical protein
MRGPPLGCPAARSKPWSTCHGGAAGGVGNGADTASERKTPACCGRAPVGQVGARSCIFCSHSSAAAASYAPPAVAQDLPPREPPRAAAAQGGPAAGLCFTTFTPLPVKHWHWPVKHWPVKHKVFSAFHFFIFQSSTPARQQPSPRGLQPSSHLRHYVLTRRRHCSPIITCTLASANAPLVSLLRFRRFRLRPGCRGASISCADRCPPRRPCVTPPSASASGAVILQPPASAPNPVHVSPLASVPGQTPCSRDEDSHAVEA